MSEKKAKTYTAEFKESAVKLAVGSDKPVTETARELEAKLMDVLLLFSASP